METEHHENLNQRLQLTQEVRISTSSGLFPHFSKIWHQPHWYEEPFGMSCFQFNVHPTPLQLEGLDKIRRAIIQYSLEFHTPGLSSTKTQTLQMSTTKSFDRSSTDSLKKGNINMSTGFVHLQTVTSSLEDVFSRLLAATQNSLTLHKKDYVLQAVWETKQIFGFFSPTEICVMRSPRALRRLLWKKRLKFGSLFGHSASLDPLVNLSPEDFDALSDVGANFPGCVRWLSIIEEGGLSQRSRQMLHRLREFIIFQGKEEVVPFLNLLLEIIKDFTPSTETKSSQESSLNYYMMRSGLDITWTKRIVANFCFRESSVRIPEILWEGHIGAKQWFLRLRCCLLPASQHLLFQGTMLCMEDSDVDLEFTLSEATKDVWSPLTLDLLHTTSTHLGVFANLLHKFPEALVWLKTHGLRCTFHFSSRPLASSVLVLNYSAPTPEDRALVPSTTRSLLPSPSVSLQNQKTLSLVLVPSELRVQPKKRVRAAPSITSLFKKLRSRDEPNGDQKPIMNHSLNHAMKNNHLELLPVESYTVDQIWNNLTAKYRQAVRVINDVSILFVGPFPFIQCMNSVPFSDLFRFLSPILPHIDYLVVSCTISLQELNTLKLQPGCAVKLRTLFWFLHFFQESLTHNSDALQIQENQHEDYSTLHTTDFRWKSLFQDILPKFITLNTGHDQRSSRNVFFWVSNLALADLVSPLSCNPLTHILLDTSRHTLKARLWQMAQKQDYWESLTLQELSRHSGEKLVKLRHTFLSSCPSFLVHLLFILPTDLSSLKKYTSQPVFLKNLHTAQKLQQTFPFNSPRLKISGETIHHQKNVPSRLLLWCLPLDFVKEAYNATSPHKLVELLHQFQQTFPQTAFNSTL